MNEYASLTYNARGDLVDDGTWAYDPATGLLTKKTYNDGTSDVYDYNAKFQLTSLTRPGVFINYHYDASGRQTTTDATDNASGLTVTDSVGGYDDQGRATSVTQTTSDPGGETQSTATNTYTYDKNGNLASETQAGGVTTVYNYYDPTDLSPTAEPGALENVRLVQGGHVISETDYYYSPSSKRLASITVLAYQNGTLAASQDFTYTYKSGTNLVESITAGEVETTYGYETNTGRLSSITTTTTATDPISTLYDAEYTYFNNDQRKTESVTQLDSDGNTNSHNWTFTYDAQNELTGVTNTVGGASVYSYSYDGAGNRNDAAFTATYGVADGMNQLANLTYNARGDLVDDGIYHYTWNALDQLVSVTPDNPTTGSQKLEEQYDASARRVETDSYNWNATTGEWDDEADNVLKYVYQGSQLAAELDGNNNPIVTLARGANGTLISITDYTSGTPHIYVVLQDATSNTVGLANPANGAVVASFQYAPFGGFTSDDGPEANACPEMFAGMIYDGNAALPYYAWHRYYSPSEGRWISRDSIAEQGGPNLDGYCGDDPINLTDAGGTTWDAWLDDARFVVEKRTRQLGDDQIRVSYDIYLRHAPLFGDSYDESVSHAVYDMPNGVYARSSLPKFYSALVEELNNKLAYEGAKTAIDEYQYVLKQSAILAVSSAAGPLLQAGRASQFAIVANGSRIAQLGAGGFFAYQGGEMTVDAFSQVKQGNYAAATADLILGPVTALTGLKIGVGSGFVGKPNGIPQTTTMRPVSRLRPRGGILINPASEPQRFSLQLAPESQGNYNLSTRFENVPPNMWESFPDGVPRPTGPINLLDDPAYDTARGAADKINRRLSRRFGLGQANYEIHEINPVKYGGSPTALSNKVGLLNTLHRQATTWFNALQRLIEGG